VVLGIILYIRAFQKEQSPKPYCRGLIASYRVLLSLQLVCPRGKDLILIYDALARTSPVSHRRCSHAIAGENSVCSALLVIPSLPYEASMSINLNTAKNVLRICYAPPVGRSSQITNVYPPASTSASTATLVGTWASAR
jgi:hypothetical protein